ncbi:stealth family protein [Subtercola boreus]|uniref:Sugar phosphotransferase n=1 Tax=Subtercola boreus TaxID=120213 RepID=A0A3E0W9B6_9MICO|nr:stealth family protein [Subtercola boreus]RFA20229.1 sugar phosphotransferase [Subtercola boreus]RFA20381.1 sugar phosphotransferase [Subtercola boreus]RFA26633.1 sugar phosphotransferase [Subtercola boreus]
MIGGGGAGLSAGSAATHNVALENPLEPDASEELFTRGSGRSGAPRSWPKSHGRPDVVVRKGMLALVNETLTPHEALVEDLLFVRRALQKARIAFFLIRGNDERPVIVVDAAARRKLERALALACQNEPMYAKTVTGKKRPPLLVSTGVLSESRKARIFRLYRPRVEPRGGLTYGSSIGIELQLWSFEAENIICPVENSLTRRILPRSEANPTTVNLYGHSWNTLRGMFDIQATDVVFDIDMVFSWVDGNDIDYQRRRRAQGKGYVAGDGDDSDARYRQIDELKYALRSVYLFAPWVRRIFIATDSPKPAWLAEHPRVTFVRSEEFFGDVTVLPTHNSQAVESQLHRIPGISEYFLYSNDDMFFGRPVQPNMFFSPGGVTKFIEAQTRIGLGENDLERSGFENAARVNRRLLSEKFGRIITRHLEHAAAPLRRSVMAELEGEFPEDFRRTAASRFRSSTDISVTNSLYHYYALMTGQAVVQEAARVAYVDTTVRSGLGMLPEILRKRAYDFFCLNDGSFPEVSAEERTAVVQAFLEQYFPFPAPWETERAARVPLDKGQFVAAG